MIYDPDYARAFTIIRCLAWSYGYAACLHGSFTRDLDVVLVPWAENAAPAQPLVNLIAQDTGTKVQGQPSVRPHGRQTWTLTFPAFGDPRWIDVSVMPTQPPAATRPGGTAMKETPISDNARINCPRCKQVWTLARSFKARDFK